MSTLYDYAREVFDLLFRLSCHLFASHNLKTPEQRNAAATRNSKVSPLLQLPPELRNIIYNLVLGTRTIYRAPIFTHDSHDSTPYQLSLPLVCSQIFAEAQPILRFTTVFRFDYVSELENWVARHSQTQRDAVRIVEIGDTVERFLNRPWKGPPKPMTFYLPNARVMSIDIFQ